MTTYPWTKEITFIAAMFFLPGQRVESEGSEVRVIQIVLYSAVVFLRYLSLCCRNAIRVFVFSPKLNSDELKISPLFNQSIKILNQFRITNPLSKVS